MYKTPWHLIIGTVIVCVGVVGLLLFSEHNAQTNNHCPPGMVIVHIYQGGDYCLTRKIPNAVR